MSFSLWLEYTTSNVKRIMRNKSAFFFTILFPIIFVGIFGLAFQQSDPATGPQTLGVITYDNGIPTNATVWYGNQTVSGMNISHSLIHLLKTLTYENSTTPLFTIREFSPSKLSIARRALETRDIYGLLVLPSDFSLGYMAAFRSKYQNNSLFQSLTNNWQGYPNANYSCKIPLEGDHTLQNYMIIQTILREIFSRFFAFHMGPVGGELVLKSSIQTEGLTTFDFILPGLVIFAILQLISTVASSVLYDVETGILLRIRITQVKGSTYVLALASAQFMIAFLQVILVLGTSLLFGFPFHPWTFFNAFLVSLLLVFAVIGIGLLAASFMKSSTAGGALAGIVSTPMAFISGAFFPVPNPVIIPSHYFFSDYSLKLFDILPSTTTIRILRSILLENKTLLDVSTDLIVLAITSLLFLTLGITLFWKYHFKESL